ncbi:MAG: dihydrofolate reductase [Eubacteriaceae bacterium]|jgi:dihydrofolate reductase|nr:dihydrofolate reductase [Eubacteriaceae bacterium]
MNAIVAVDKNWGIGRDGELLVHIPGDMKFFREKTTGKNIIIGRKTLESFPDGRPLPDRHNIVLTSNDRYAIDGCTVCCGVEALMRLLGKFADDSIFVCGGESVYRLLLPYVDTIWITKIDKEFEADKHFPNLDKDEDFEAVWESEPMEHKGTGYRFLKYERKQNEDE